MEMQDLVTAARQFPTQRSLEWMTGVVVNSDPHDAGVLSASRELLLDPGVGLGEPGFEGDGGLPAEDRP